MEYFRVARDPRQDIKSRAVAARELTDVKVLAVDARLGSFRQCRSIVESRLQKSLRSLGAEQCRPPSSSMNEHPMIRVGEMNELTIRCMRLRLHLTGSFVRATIYARIS